MRETESAHKQTNERTNKQNTYRSTIMGKERV